MIKSGTNVKDALVKNYIKGEMEKEKIPTSVLGEKLGTDEVTGILSMYKSFYELNEKMDKVEIKYLKGKMEKEKYKATGS